MPLLGQLIASSCGGSDEHGIKTNIYAGFFSSENSRGVLCCLPFVYQGAEHPGCSSDRHAASYPINFLPEVNPAQVYGRLARTDEPARYLISKRPQLFHPSERTYSIEYLWYTLFINLQLRTCRSKVRPSALANSLNDGINAIQNPRIPFIASQPPRSLFPLDIIHP